ncbi:ethanolamine ammonia-lyase light chain EutC, partial [Escherichia coli]|nr:ethanolamine ammonia-lyase light chain EutC [Escherichia coli]
IREALRVEGLDSVEVRSAVADRTEYLRRPDKGRSLDPGAASALDGHGPGFDVAVVIADGLSATAVALNAVPAAAALAARVRRAG